MFVLAVLGNTVVIVALGGNPCGKICVIIEWALEDAIKVSVGADCGVWLLLECCGLLVECNAFVMEGTSSRLLAVAMELTKGETGVHKVMAIVWKILE